ncbi:DUF11 domain-containing protein [Akkermansiaceae bacterium]|nr:DUF11 domain-containing protein [Akkermansiaceae bacterium]
MPEAQIRQSFLILASNTGTTMDTVVSMVVGTSGTRMVYDHWEDGYEVDINNPTQASTQIWGDGNDANGKPPGYAQDPTSLDAGTVIALRNNVSLPRNPSSILFDGRDRVGSTKGIVMSRSSWATTPGSVLADATEVSATIDWGRNFVMPVGENEIFPTPATSSMFELVSIFVQASQNGTVVQLDRDGNGSVDTTVTLNQGENYYLDRGILKGATVAASKPVQVHLLTGDIGANYESRWYTVAPLDQWGSSYYTPVGTANDGDDTYIFLYNPDPAAITVNYTTRSGTGSFVLPANDSYRFLMPQDSGAHFYNTASRPFFAIGAVGAKPTANNVHDWGFSLVPEGNLTTSIVCGWGPGSSNLSVNGSPVWATAVGNTRIYVDYGGDYAGPQTDPDGDNYDVHYDISALEVQRLYDPSRDQTGMRVYTLDGTLITGAWGQDPAVAGPGNPFLDAGTTIPAFPVPVITKSYTIVNDVGATGLSVGDTLEYLITMNNNSLVALGNLFVVDGLPPTLTYVAGSTTRDTVAISDNLSPSSAFPLDETGIIIPVLPRGGVTRLRYRTVINAGGSITNTVSTSFRGVTSSVSVAVPDGSSPCTINFTNSGGTTVATYNEGSGIYIQMSDPDANTNSSTIQTVTVLVKNTTNGDLEFVTLTETTASSGVFRNTTAVLPSSTTAGLAPYDGTLNGLALNNLSVSYTDPIFGDSASATATIIAPGLIKQLYLTTDGTDNDNTGNLDRVDPVNTADGSTSQTAILGQATIVADSPSSSSSTVFTSTPVQPAFASVSTTSGSASSFTFSHNPGNGANRLLLVGVTLRNNASQSVSSVTFGGAALTRVGTQANGSNARVEIWSLTNPSSGAANVVVTLSASGQASIGATTFTGVDQITPLEAFTSNTGSSTTPAVGVTAASDQLVYDTVALNADSNNLAVAGGQTRRWNVRQSATLIGASSTSAGADSVTMSWTSTNGPWAIGAVAIRSAGSTVSVNHTTGSGSNRLMLVGLSYEDDDNDGFKVPSVSYAGLPLTRLIQRASAVEAGSEIWYLINPPSGAGTVTVATAGAGATDDEIVVGVSTFSGVNQANPFGTAVSAIGSSGPATVNVSSASGELVFDTVALDDSRRVTVGSGQAQQWNLNTDNAGDGVSGAGSTEPGASSVTMSWTLTNNDDWAICAVPIKPAAGTPVTFTQTPAFAEAFSMTSLPSVIAYYSVSSGTMPASPDISAVLRKNGIPFATSTGVTASGGLLTFTFPVNPTNFVANDVISLVISNGQSGVTFRLDYDSTTRPSRINLPTNTVIRVDSVGVYDAPFPGGTLTTTPANGQTLYVRTVVGDPFGAYDITSLPLSIDGPGAASDISVTLGASNVVATTAATKTYEYVWNTGTTTGAYNIAATAREGFENTITSQRSTAVNMSFLDLGTPSTTEFTVGNNGAATNTYNPNVSVGVRVTDIDKNKLPGVVETITAVITSSSGDSELVTLTETGPNTGVFTFVIPASSTAPGTSNNGTLHAPQGSALTVNYVDPDDSSDTSSANATVPLPTGTPGISVSKTLLAPSDGQAVIGEAVQYRLRVVNTGSTTLSTVSLTDTFPAANLTYGSASTAPNTVASGSLTWTNVGPLTPGQSVTIIVNFTALASGNPVTNSATANAGGGVTSTSTRNVIITRPAVTVTKTLVSPNPGPANKGDDVVFNINVNNTGDTPISSLPLEDIYSGATFEFVSASVPPDSTGSGSLLWLDITGAGSLAAGSSQNITVTLRAIGAASPATNRAEVSFAVDSNGDPVPPSISSASLVTTAGSIYGSVLEDQGTAGYGGGDTALSGVTVTLFTDPNGDGDPSDGTLVAITETQADGTYEFLNLGLGNYTVVETDPFGFESIADTQGANDNRIPVTLTSSTPSTGNNFLDQFIDPALYGNISGQVRNDTDADGNLLDADSGISGVTIDLFTDPNGDGNPADGVLFTTTLTNGSGNYSFTNLPPGSYVVVESDPTGFVSTADITLPNDNRIPVTVAASQTSTGNDFLDTSNLAATGTIGNLIWSDTNNNGVFDSGETGINGVAVQLYRSSQTPGVDVPYKTTTTSGGGIYSFGNVPADTYIIYLPTSNFGAGKALETATLSSYFTDTADNQQDNDDNGIQSAAGQAISSPALAIAAGETDNSVDFGFVPVSSYGSISGTVQADTNNDNAGDVGIQSVGMTLYTDPNGDGDFTDGVVFATTSTAVGGAYSFTGLPPGAYVVVETQPSGFLTITDTDGGTDDRVAINLPVAGSGTASFVEVQSVSISGNVFNDANGLLGTPVNTVDGATYGGATVYANLVENGAVVQAVAATSGAYDFSGVAGYKNYTVVLSTTQGTIGAAPPAASLPSGYVNTGENVGAGTGSDGTVNGSLAVPVTNASVTNANFGVERIPTASNVASASQLNPAGTAQVTVPTLTATDPEDASVTSFIINTLPSNGTLYYDGSAVTVGQTITSYNASLLTLDPNDGAITASFTYSAVDAAGKSSAPATATMPFTAIGISGNVFNDANGLLGTPVNTVDGTAYAGPTLYANLVSGGNVAQVVTVTAGAYNFGTVAANTNYTVVLSTTQGTVGAAAPAASLPSGYVNTGENVGAGTGSDGTVNGSLAVPVVTSSVTNANFGVELIPTATNVSSASQLNPAGTAQVTVPTLTATDPEDTSVTSFTINTLPTNGTLYYNGSAVTLGQTITSYNASLLKLDPDDGAITASFTYSAVDAAGKSSAPATATMPFTAIGISGNVFNDANGLLGTPVNTVDGTAYAGPTLYANLVSGGNVAQVVTVTAGAYNFGTVAANTNYTVVLSTTQGTVGAAAPAASLPAGYVNTGENVGAGTGSDGTVNGSLAVPVVTSSVTNANFGVRENGTVSGHLYIDTNGNGSQDSGEPDLANVDVVITDSFGAQQTVATNSSGNWTASVPPGSTTANVDETDPQYPTGSIQKEGTDPTTVTAVAGADTSAGNDGYFLPGSITGIVRVDNNNDGTPDAIRAGAILSLQDGNGDPVLGAGNVPVTTVTAANGTYSFGNLPPGTYQVAKINDPGYRSISDKDGGNPELIAVIVVNAGQVNPLNDFLEMLQKCPDLWTEWQDKWDTILGGETAFINNPDGDRYSNLLEYAFCMPPNSGGRKPFCLVNSLSVTGGLDGVFSRTAGGPQDVTYILDYAAALGDPTSWNSITLTGGNTTVTNNGDGSETVRIVDLESLTGLTAGAGFVRIRVQLDNGVDTAEDSTEVLGWVETQLGMCCRTYNNPFLPCATFTGTVDSVNGQELVLTTSAGSSDLSTLLVPGTSYYIEVETGDLEGHRFDVTGATATSLTLANDASLSSASPPFNTLTGAAPALLAGDRIALHTCKTLNGQFPAASFGAGLTQETSDEVQVFANGTWAIYWLFEDGAATRWVNADDVTMVDAGATVIPAGQGVFFHNRTAPTSILAYGEVRGHDFHRPLLQGVNMVGGGYPLDQSAIGNNSRGLNLADGFFGSRNFKTADSFFVWRTDGSATASGYDTYFLLDGGASQPTVKRWVKTGDVDITPRDAELLLKRDGGVMTRVATDKTGYVIPTPWTP